MKFATYCWLLVTLAGTTALAQTHPKKKRGSKPAVVHKQIPKVLSTNELIHYPPLVEEYPRCDLRTAVAEPFDSTRVYVYVGQMPTLNGQNAFTASIAAITQFLVVLPDAPDGRVFVAFEVNRAGRVSHARIVKGLRADLDSAVVKATRLLPRFTPGKQGGQVVSVSVVIPVTIPAGKQP